VYGSEWHDELARSVLANGLELRSPMLFVGIRSAAQASPFILCHLARQGLPALSPASRVGFPGLPQDTGTVCCLGRQ